MDAGVIIDKEFEVASDNRQGEFQFSCFVEKLKNNSITRIFGTWNRKFIFVNMHMKTVYYSSGPSTDAQTEIRMKVCLYDLEYRESADSRQ